MVPFSEGMRPRLDNVLNFPLKNQQTGQPRMQGEPVGGRYTKEIQWNVHGERPFKPTIAVLGAEAARLGGKKPAGMWRNLTLLCQHLARSTALLQQREEEVGGWGK